MVQVGSGWWLLAYPAVAFAVQRIIGPRLTLTPTAALVHRFRTTIGPLTMIRGDLDHRELIVGAGAIAGAVLGALAGIRARSSLRSSDLPPMTAHAVVRRPDRLLVGMAAAGTALAIIPAPGAMAAIIIGMGIAVAIACVALGTALRRFEASTGLAVYVGAPFRGDAVLQGRYAVAPPSMTSAGQ